jgi:hypothetical protein
MTEAYPDTPAPPGGGRARRAVVGVGTVGLHRALSLDDAGFDGTAYDVDRSVVDVPGVFEPEPDSDAVYRRG